MRRVSIVAATITFGLVAGGPLMVVPGALAAARAGNRSDAGGEGAGLARLRQQRVSWHGCQTGPDDALGRELDQAGVQCAEVTVPLDYTRPGDRTISVALSRLKATDTAHRRGVLLVNPGGPGEPALDFPLTVSSIMGEAASRYDLVGFDHRFVGRSAPIDCGPITLGTALGSAGTDRAGFEQSVRTSADYARRCHERQVAVLPYATTADLARDMDMFRAALDERRISYYGVSYGADLGAVYSQLFPDRVDRMVIDSATAVTTEYEATLASIEPGEEAVDEWAAWTSQRNAEYGLGRTGTEVRTALTRLIGWAARQPIPVGDYRVDDNILPLILRMWLGDEGNNPALAAAVRDLTAIAAGQPVQPSPELLGVLSTLNGEDPLFTNVIAAIFAVRCSDGGWPRDPNQYWARIERSRSTYPVFGPLYHNINACAFWQDASAQPPVAIGNSVPILMVQALRDNNTPIAGARELHRKLTGSRLLTVDVRTHGVYVRQADGQEPIPCAVQAVNDYLDGGPLAVRDRTCG